VLNEICGSIGWDTHAMKFASERMRSLLRTLEVIDVDVYTPATLVADFATLVATYTDGFKLIIEPYDSRYPEIQDPQMELACLDASIAIKPVLDRFQSVILTSGTIAVKENLYPQILHFTPVTSRSFKNSFTGRCKVCPIIVSMGTDQVAMTSQYKARKDKAVVQNFFLLLKAMAEIVPDGIVCFFVSYISMDQIVTSWYKDGRLKQLLEKKLIFIETPDMVESSVALRNYRLACDSGRGAIFLSVARGKVAEGVDFEKHYGRAVLMFGVPYQYTESLTLRARLDYTRDKYRIRENDFLTFDALRQASQCVGRVIRSKNDYGIMIFADERYTKLDKKSKLPQWILDAMPNEHVGVDTRQARAIVKRFLADMALPEPRPGAKSDVQSLSARAAKRAAGPELVQRTGAM